MVKTDVAYAAPVLSLQLFFNEMGAAFENAAGGVCETDAFDFTIAGHGVCVRTAGDGLRSVIYPAMAHLLAGTPDQPALEISIWDEQSTGIALPQPPWHIPQADEKAVFVFPDTDPFQISISADREVLSIGDRSTNRMFMWIRDASRLFNHDYAAPLMHIFRTWALSDKLAVVHAGCVGNGEGAVLLVGKGGSGKSTVSLLSVLHGLDYLSDDYTLVKFGEEPEAFCLYNTGKLHAYHLKRFPELERLAVTPGADKDGKPLIYLEQHFPGQIAGQRNLKAIIAPVVTGKPDSALVRISAMETLKALALSTLFQLRNDDKSALNKMAGLVKLLPGYRLELGTDIKQIAPLIKQLL